MNVSEDGLITLKDLKFVPASEVDREERRIQQGDVIFNNTNSPELVGKTAYYGESEPRAFSNHMTRLRCRPEVIDAKYCAMALHQLWRKGYFQEVSNNHVSQASVSRAVLLDTVIPIPPLSEQRRIVERIETFLSCLGAARARLGKASGTLKGLRQSILRAACSGALTADWRDASPGAAGDSAAVPTVSVAEDLPTGWRWVSLDDLRDPDRPIIYGIIKPGPHVPSGVPYVRVVEMKEGHINVATLRRASPDRAHLFRRATLRAGDLLISKDGTIGRVAVVPSDLEGGNITQHLVRVTPSSVVCRDYLVWAIRSPVAQEWLTGERKGVALQGVNVEDFRRLPIPLPPRPEQDEIVRRVDGLFKLVDAAEMRLAVAVSRCEKIIQAVLAKAFAGELVPTEAELARQAGCDYKPASELLTRIRAARTREEQPKRRVSPRSRAQSGSGV